MIATIITFVIVEPFGGPAPPAPPFDNHDHDDTDDKSDENHNGGGQ